MMSSPKIPPTQKSRPSALQNTIWQGSLPLSIRLAPSECRIYDQIDPYLIHCPRLSYLPFLLPRLHAFFTPFFIRSPSTHSAHDGWLSFEDIPLKWHYPLGLLHDLFSGAAPFPVSTHAPASKPVTTSSSHKDEAAEDEDDDDDEEEKGGRESAELPWRLVVHFSDWPDEQLVRLDAEGKVMHDAFINSVKEADFLRNGTAKGIMALSKDDSTMLWRAVMEHNLPLYNPISQKLLRAQGAPLRHIPLKIYLPAPPPPPPTHPAPSTTTTTTTNSSPPNPTHTLRVVQSPINPSQTLGTALHALLPSLFPSRRIPILARPVLHGAVVPMAAELETLVMQGAAYADGWLHVGVVMMG